MIHRNLENIMQKQTNEEWICVCFVYDLLAIITSKLKMYNLQMYCDCLIYEYLWDTLIFVSIQFSSIHTVLSFVVARVSISVRNTARSEPKAERERESRKKKNIKNKYSIWKEKKKEEKNWSCLSFRDRLRKNLLKEREREKNNGCATIQ